MRGISLMVKQEFSKLRLRVRFSHPAPFKLQTNMTQTTNTTEAKVYQLCQELEDIKKRKKAFVKAYNVEIRRIQDEIKDILNPEEAVVELP